MLRKHPYLVSGSLVARSDRSGSVSRSLIDIRRANSFKKGAIGELARAMLALAINAR